MIIKIIKPYDTYLYKVKIENTRAMLEICSKIQRLESVEFSPEDPPPPGQFSPIKFAPSELPPTPVGSPLVDS